MEADAHVNRPPADPEQDRLILNKHVDGDRLHIPLQDLRYPKQCQQDSQHTSKLFAAYLSDATIIVTIWANYDACTKQAFHDEPRISTCGQLVLSPRQRARIEFMNSDGTQAFQMKHIRLDVGTPFRTLCRLALDYDDHRLNVSGTMCADACSPHRQLRRFAVQTLNMISGGAWHEAEGLMLCDLDLIASWFLMGSFE